jgi:hypothetical protein
MKSAVAECMNRQVETAIDIVNDGEQGKPGFFTYLRERTWLQGPLLRSLTQSRHCGEPIT